MKIKGVLCISLILLSILAVIIAEENESGVILNPTNDTRICCKITETRANLGDEIVKYLLVDEGLCVTPRVGGIITKEIVDKSLCLKDEDEKRTQLRERIKAWVEGEECPRSCICQGVTMKCEIEGGREMTVYAGKSGNIIIQVKGVNVSTEVTLYKDVTGELYGSFEDGERKIKVLPDQVEELIKEKAQKSIEDTKAELDEKGIYKANAKKRAKFLGFIPVKETVRARINSDTGEIKKFGNSWWGFLARDMK